jgi:hypothetical protein
MDESLTVICHFRNEEVYLPYWLRQHSRLFDHGILIDYASTDRSVEIIRRLTPGWEIRPSRNPTFTTHAIDAEVMDVERGLRGWKMCLNVTEFVLHHNLRYYLQEFQRKHPGAPGLVTTGFVIHDAPAQVGLPLTGEDLWVQRHFGYPEPDPTNHGQIDRSRLLHCAPHGGYGAGRHQNSVSNLKDPPLFLFWYGWCPLDLKRRRNRSTRPMLAQEDLARGWGMHHALSDEQVPAAWRQQYLPHCHDLLDGRCPLLKEAVEELTRQRRAAAPA